MALSAGQGSCGKYTQYMKHRGDSTCTQSKPLTHHLASLPSGLLPPADGVHAVSGRNPEGLVLGPRETVTERAQTQALVVTTTRPLHHVAHGLSVR